MPPFFDPRMALYDAYGKEASKHFRLMNDVQKLEREYGSTIKWNVQPPCASNLAPRRQLNVLSISLAVLVPFGLFAVTSWAMAFDLYYHHPDFALLVVAAAFLFSLVLGACTVHKRCELTGRPSTWLLFTFCSSMAACILGSCLGYLNMTWNTIFYYDYINLRKVIDVDPGGVPGKQVLDAGEVDFKLGTKLDLTLHSQWHKGKIWCIAPIVSSDGAKLASYDFWAVGTDCCSGAPNDFSCGLTNFGAAGSPGGLRVIEDSDLQGYKLAVKQAMSAYNIQSNQPIFLQMMNAPYLKIKSYMDEAELFAIISAICYFIMQSILVAAQAYVFGIGAPSGYLDMNKNDAWSP